ncbi:alkyl sulfatase dimerization domain-containing protein [Vibrio cyclitrophicus]|uniref:alkyl sulfatase dimerization domain-containing protein n=1 Tax=Vibrio TaxID=662 RepID=UPI0002E58617|nr:MULTISPECIES: alkyl sulfatase dimerization domain-containing protein [Vibrio]MBE8558379.1 hypothetical protein [Vibrio sp. OPT24]NOH17715.1 hypothetical protein [Vibrio cyclitrophicus]OBS94001.1 hypothetical protein A9259_15245 [Vibrio cyclitrophicus]OED70691.1 hypothetical protein OAU_06735 [Vibrio cyclitrophicus ZF99]PME74370.1 hypothetical protein BCV31_02105 [Vibrio cyclitrophicus]
MKNTLVSLTITALSLSSFSAAAQVAELPTGQVGNVTSVMKVQPVLRMGYGLEHESPLSNVHLLSGAPYAPVVIELDKGLIVFSTGDDADEGAQYRQYIRANISDKPIIAVFYDHNHYTKGTQTLLDGDNAEIYAHPDLHKIISARTGDSQSNTEIPEMAPHLLARASIHYGNHADKSGSDASIVPSNIKFGAENGYLEPTQILGHGESVTIEGLEIQAFIHDTDTKDTLTFWIPEYELIVDNVVWPFHNMYTLRGDAYRAPHTWLGGLRDIRDLEPEIVLNVGGGAKALVGKENIQQTINAVLDSQSYVYDQSIRLTNLGVAPNQIHHHVEMPTTFNEHPYVNNMYGQFDTFFAAFPVRNHGNFSGHPDDLHTMEKVEKAHRLIKLSGGVDKVYEAWQTAIQKGETIWAKELSTMLYYNAPDNDVARQAHADSLRKLGQESEGLIARNFYMAGVKSLETSDSDVSLMASPSASWVASDPETAIDYLRTRLNPAKAANISGKLGFIVDGKEMQLEMRNRVAEFSTTIADDAEVIKISGEKLGQYYDGTIAASDIASGKALELLSHFDEYKPVTMYPRSFTHLQ